MQNRKLIKNMVFVSLGAVFLAIGAWITVPFAVPFTMQTFALFLLLDIFGGKTATASVLLYIALGMAGIPVFSGFNSGVAVVIGPTGGFIIGFALAGCAYLALQSILTQKTYPSAVLPFFSILLCYACGTAWYMLYCSSIDTSVGISTALSVCVLPYIIPDCIKILLALTVSKRVKKSISL